MIQVKESHRSARRWCLVCVASIGLAVFFDGANTVFAQEAQNFRRPADDDEARRWLGNMIWFHQMTHHEIHRATGWTFAEIDDYQSAFDIYPDNRPARSISTLTVLPYPGGRHPRIGFLDGAVKPQRETKVSVFLPWPDAGYVVADVPEAIWSNLGLTYLAHTHVETIWTREGIELEPLEWTQIESGILQCTRDLPNGISFTSTVTPQENSVRFELTLTNGTGEPLTGMRVQNCVMLKAARGFEAQTTENKVLRDSYAACHNESGDRWIITSWKPIHRCWANERCPCLHSDPIFPDCAPGETVSLQGWLSFYEGTDIAAELSRIENLAWYESDADR